MWNTFDECRESIKEMNESIRFEKGLSANELTEKINQITEEFEINERRKRGYGKSVRFRTFFVRNRTLRTQKLCLYLQKEPQIPPKAWKEKEKYL